jgi:chromosome segregation ATPase
MELPIEKQLQIMDALRRFSIRETSQLCNVPKSTVQNYKKYGPPYFRRLKKILSIEQYPATLQEENEFLKKAIQEVLRQAKQAIDQRNTANKIVVELTAIKNLKDNEIERQKQEKEEQQKTMNKQKEDIENMKHDHQRELDEQKTNVEEKKKHEIQEIKNEFLKTQQELNSELTDTKEELRHANETIELFKKRCEKIEFDYWILQHRQKTSLLKHGINTIVSFSVGTLFGYYGIPALQNFFFPQNVEYEKNTGTFVTPILQSVSI